MDGPDTVSNLVLKLLKIDHVCLNVADPREAAARYARAVRARGARGGRRPGHAGVRLRAVLARARARGAARGGPHRLAAAAVVLARRGRVRTWPPRPVPIGATRATRSSSRPGGLRAPHRGLSRRRRSPARDRAADVVLGGLRPRKLGHINRLTADLAATTRFHTDVLGMEIADYLATPASGST